MGQEDDVFQEFQCPGGFWRNGHANVIFSDAGNIYMGLTRIFAFFVIFGLNWYNRSLLRSRLQENVNIIPGLVLPYYFLYLYLLIFLSIMCGIIDITVNAVDNTPSKVNNWIVPIEQGLFHWLYEGLAIFLMRYGAGFHAMKLSLFYSGLWGIFYFLISFFSYSLIKGSYGFDSDEDSAYGLFLALNVCVLLFYAVILFSPPTIIYRRPALDYYCIFNIVFYSFYIICISLLDGNVTDAVCPASVIAFILIAFIQPFVIFRTLQMDSQYWQGLKPDKGNPLAEVWDHIDIATAESMAESLEQFSADRIAAKDLPIFHFGLLDFDQDEHFVAGGFSRVYFGRCKGEKVAFKILFAMELTPDDVKDFYQEALLLASLKHECIVGCKGICIMPPALTLVLEHCSHGSLYDFLYKPIAARDIVAHQKEITTSWNARFFGGSKQDRADLVTIVRQSERESVANIFNPLRGTNNLSDKDNLSQPLQVMGSGSVHFASPPVIDRPSDMSSHRSSTQSYGEGEGDRNSQRASTSMRDSYFNGRQSLSRRVFETLANIITPSTRASGSSRTSYSNQTVITAATHIPFPLRAQMMKDAISGIVYLHKKGFLHCDVKSLNYLVDEVFINIYYIFLHWIIFLILIFLMTTAFSSEIIRYG